MAVIEENWRHLDTLFDDLVATGDWSQKHSRDWTFANLPYHLDNCNQEMLIRGLEAGPDQGSGLFRHKASLAPR